MRRVSGLLLTAALLGGSNQAAMAQASPPDPMPLSETTVADPGAIAAIPPIEVSVDCYSSPERVIITNNRAKPIAIKRLGSTYRRRPGEPYKVKRVLRPGHRVTYTFGTGKGGNRLSGSFIFDNGSSREGVLVRTNKGRVTVECSEGTNAPPEPVDLVRAEERQEIVTGRAIDALDLLAALSIEPEVGDGYDRTLFEHWVDEDHDGCDTRQEVLIAESLTPVLVGDRCGTEEGTWFSAADGDTLTNPASMDINHTVPLKEAWASGAHTWSPERRRSFANDLQDARTLQAVSSGVNRQQGARDPAAWLPIDRDVACTFVIDWVAIKATWGLSLDELERDAIELTLQSCPDRTVTLVKR